MNESLSDKIKEIYGTDVTIKEKSPIYGGDINESFMVTLSNGERVFLKENYDSYRSAFPFEPGYADRRDLYNLYHLLNHLNLFGGSYLGGVLRIVRRYG